ncbi:MAG: hypothetical protein K6E87_00620 [bacterium]|nr:hypothetical protein [bacterium]
MNNVKYNKAKLYYMDLNSLYEGNEEAFSLLDKNLLNIVNTEAPITMNIVKARLREAFNIGKISGKALEIIDSRINALGFNKTDNFYDTVLWPSGGIFDVTYLREGAHREIYDIPYQEMYNLVCEINLYGEELYRKILEYFGGQVLTHKAEEYLKFIEKKCK